MGSWKRPKNGGPLSEIEIIVRLDGLADGEMFG